MKYLVRSLVAFLILSTASYGLVLDYEKWSNLEESEKFFTLMRDIHQLEFDEEKIPEDARDLRFYLSFFKGQNRDEKLEGLEFKEQFFYAHVHSLIDHLRGTHVEGSDAYAEFRYFSNGFGGGIVSIVRPDRSGTVYKFFSQKQGNQWVLINCKYTLAWD